MIPGLLAASGYERNDNIENKIDNSLSTRMPGSQPGSTVNLLSSGEYDNGIAFGGGFDETNPAITPSPTRYVLWSGVSQFIDSAGTTAVDEVSFAESEPGSDGSSQFVSKTLDAAGISGIVTFTTGGNNWYAQCYCAGLPWVADRPGSLGYLNQVHYATANRAVGFREDLNPIIDVGAALNFTYLTADNSPDSSTGELNLGDGGKPLVILARAFWSNKVAAITTATWYGGTVIQQLDQFSGGTADYCFSTVLLKNITGEIRAVPDDWDSGEVGCSCGLVVNT